MTSSRAPIFFDSGGVSSEPLSWFLFVFPEPYRAPFGPLPLPSLSLPHPCAMATDDHSHSRVELYESGLTVPSDSENYSANNELSSSTSSSPLILYQPPSFWSLLRGAAINLVLPFVNGLMLGFGELFAHEAAFRLGWSNTKVWLIGSP